MDSADWFSAPFTAAARCNSTAGRPALEHRQPTDRWKCNAMPLGWKEGSGCLERRTPSRSPANASHALPIPSASFSCAGGLRANFVDDERGTVRAALLRDGGFWKRRRLPTTPERMVEMMAQCQFTSGADAAVVLRLYEQTAKAVLGSIEHLDYSGLPLLRGDGWCSPARLAEALNR